MRKFIFVFVMLLFIFPLVSAVNTEIKVKTLADHKVSIFVLASDQIYSLLESFHKTADGIGEVSVIYSGTAAKFDVAVKISKDNKKIFYERFEDYQAGSPISMRIDYEQITGNYGPDAQQIANETNSTVNETLEETAEQQNENIENVSVKKDSDNENEDITGEVVSASNSNFSKIFYYIMGILFILAIVFFATRQFMIKRSGLRNFGSSPSSSFRATPKTSTSSFKPLITGQDSSLLNREIKRLQNQLESAQREIRLLKNQEKIKEVEFRIRDEQKELDRLKRGEGM